MGKEYTDAQKRATDEYRKKNKARTNYLAKRSTAKNFIKNHAEKEDLNDLVNLIRGRRVDLKYFENDMKIIAYPALFYFDKNDSYYFIHFPDFDVNGTQGNDINDALYMASDWLGSVSSIYIEQGDKLPSASNINDLDLNVNNPFKDSDDYQMNCDKNKSFISMVFVDLNDWIL